MPNHVINKVYINDDDSPIKLEQIRNEVTSDGVHMDFNMLVPEPEDNDDWYGWRCDNWGTKWNAYEHIPWEWGFCFWTAWSTPLNIWYALSCAYPDCFITVEYADEDIGGDNSGTMHLRAGHVVHYVPGDRIFAANLWGYTEEDLDEEIEDDEIPLSEPVQRFLTTLQKIDPSQLHEEKSNG